MSGKITRTKNLSTKSSEKKLRAEIEKLEKAVERLPLSKQIGSREFELLTQKINQLRPGFKVRPTQFLGIMSADKIDSCDSTLRHSWGNTKFEFCDADTLDKAQSTEFGEAGFDIGIPTGSPEHPGPRFSAPTWVKDKNLFRKFGRKLLADRTAAHPSLGDFEKSKTEVDLKILWAYYVDHQSFSEIFEKYSRPENEIHLVSVADAEDCEQAMEIAAERNGTFVATDDEDGHDAVFDEINQSWNKVTARKISGNRFRVEFHVADEEGYFLDQKLDPKKSTLPLQRYLKDLVTRGYELLETAPPTEADRAAAREARDAEQAAASERDQYGKGHNPEVFESKAASGDRLGNPAWAEQKAYGQLVAVENRVKRSLAARERSIATKGMSPAEIERWESQHGEVVYFTYMFNQRPDDPERLRELVDAIITLKAMSLVGPVVTVPRPAALKPKPEPKPEPEPSAVRHERLRLTILGSLVPLFAGGVQQVPQSCPG